MGAMLADAAMGLVAGVGVGLLVRSVAKRELERQALTGHADLTRALETQGSAALARTPVEVRRGIDDGVTQGLAQLGLTRATVREYALRARQLQALLQELPW